ncbi:aprataxin and PNK-like factor isoform X2 [Arapaima gigas]
MSPREVIALSTTPVGTAWAGTCEDKHTSFHLALKQKRTMRKLELESVDGGTSIPLPEGETVLGRGSILGISDKRVSRHHGLLENRAGQLYIKPTHLNPCFSQLSLDDPPLPLEKDKWHPLHPGDLFSLLPGKHIFRVVCTDLNRTQINSQALEEEEGFNKSPEQNGQSSVTPDTKKQDEQTTVTNPREEGSSSKQASSVDSRGETDTRPRLEARKRVLPTWMMQTAANVQSPASPKAPGKRDRGKATPSQSQKAQSKLIRSAAEFTGEDSELSEDEQIHRKRRKRKKSDKEEDPQPKPVAAAEGRSRWPVRAKQDEASEESVSAVLALGTEKADERSTGNSLVGASTMEHRREVSLDSREQEDESQSTKERTRKKENNRSCTEPTSCSLPTRTKPWMRASCPYGRSCYRKNPVHFQECSHPGDSDYVEEKEEGDEEEDDGRPECPYGTNCYRKNPQHKKEYKHTTRPGIKASRSGNHVAQQDEDDFTDGDTEDGDEDSDYVPTESDDGMEMKRQKKAFLRK